jgi:putative DNA primase/helicase
VSKLADRCRGKWPSVWGQVGLGLTDKALRGKDTACPICGGKDRFRISNIDGRGTWFCHGENKGGDGVELVKQVLKVDFRRAAELIEGVVGAATAYGAIGGGNGHGGGKPKDPLKSWREANVNVFNTAVSDYLKGRGIELTAAEAVALRSHPALWHWLSQAKWPAMIAAVGPFGGPPVTCHQTFLEPDGSGKAPLEKARLFPSGASPTGGVWFGMPDPDHEFIVAEGIESALSAMRLFDAHAGCAALSDNGVRFLELPPEARRVRVFADDDELGQGAAAATEAGRRWKAEGRSVAVTMAAEVGRDANDVLMRRLKAGMNAGAAT